MAPLSSPIGAGPAFGCVTRLVMEAHQQERQVCIGNLQFNIDNSERINQVARAVSEVTKSMGRKEAAVLVLSRPDVAQPVRSSSLIFKVVEYL